MKNIALKIILIFCIILLFIFNTVDVHNLKAHIGFDKREYETRMRQHILCLMMAYPGYIVDLDLSEKGNVYLVMKSGKKILYDDKKSKSPEEKITNPDLQDMMEPIYPLYPIDSLADKNFNPGRSRVYELLKEVYGSTREQIESNLDNISTYYGNLQFNGENSASKFLQNAINELVAIAQTKEDIRKCLIPLSGTYNYRHISGTNRLSPHAFGIAIDLARDERDYWQWASRSEGQKRLETYPREIVEIFEKNNFIWGGKWGKFDILHFEYRPEIVMMSRYFGDKSNRLELWYEGAPTDNALVKEYIKKINVAFENL